MLLEDQLIAVRMHMETNPKSLETFNKFIQALENSKAEVVSSMRTMDSISHNNRGPIIGVSTLGLGLLRLCFSKKLENPEDDVILITSDDILRGVARDNDIKSEDVSYLKSKENYTQTTETEEILKNVKYSAWHDVAIFILATATLSGNLYFELGNATQLMNNLDSFYQGNHKLFWTLLAPVCGLGLYLLRSWKIFYYSILEIVVGFLLASFTADDIGQEKIYDALSVLKILGGVYIIARGFDNLGKYYRTTRHAPRWNKYFGEGKV